MDAISFLQGGGEMGKLIREKDWSANPVGEPGTWPQSLRITLGILLSSKFPMFLWWGKELTCFYNDAYRPSLGNEGKHPEILGQSAEKAWPEIWHIIKPLIDQVLAGDGATWSEDQLVPIYRNGHIEDVYWTFSYSPVKDEEGTINGVLVVCTETTNQVITLKKLADSEQQIRNLIKMASHELKTPVTTINGYVQLLMNMYKDATDPMLMNSLSIINKHVAKLTKLITDVLDVNRIESGNLSLTKEDFNITELVREIIQDVQMTVSTHKIIFDTDTDTMVFADRDRISQVLINLLVNAIKYSPRADRVNVTSRTLPGELVISFQDSGIGIDPSDHENIFEKFYRVDGYHEKTFPGLGIGLFIVKEIITNHQGKIWVESEKDKGSVFYFSLPLSN